MKIISSAFLCLMIVLTPVWAQSQANTYYFSAASTNTGSGGIDNPYGCHKKDLGAIISKLNLPIYSCLVLLPGTYSVKSVITLTSGQALAGLSTANTVLVNRNTQTNSEVIIGQGTDVSVSNLTIDMNAAEMRNGTRYGFHAVSLTNGDNLRMDSLAVKNAFAPSNIDSSVLEIYNICYDHDMRGADINNCTLYPPVDNNINGSFVLVNAFSGARTTGTIRNCRVFASATSSYAFGPGAYGVKNSVIRDNYVEVHSNGIFSDTEPNENTQYINNTYVGPGYGCYISTSSICSYIIEGNTFVGTSTTSAILSMSGSSYSVFRNNNGIYSTKIPKYEFSINISNNNFQFLNNTIDYKYAAGVVLVRGTPKGSWVAKDNYLSNGSFAGPIYANDQPMLNNTGVYHIRVSSVASGGVLASIPPRFRIASIAVTNTTTNAVNGGINIGTSTNGSDVVSSYPIAGSYSSAGIPSSSLLKSYFTPYNVTSPQPLYISAVSSWNNAALQLSITVEPAF